MNRFWSQASRVYSSYLTVLISSVMGHRASHLRTGLCQNSGSPSWWSILLRACSVCPGMKGMDRIRAGLNPYMTCKGFNPVYSCPIPPLLWNKRTKHKWDEATPVGLEHLSSLKEIQVMSKCNTHGPSHTERNDMAGPLWKVFQEATDVLPSRPKFSGGFCLVVNLLTHIYRIIFHFHNACFLCSQCPEFFLIRRTLASCMLWFTISSIVLLVYCLLTNMMLTLYSEDKE
jgi:hypothetical protein